MPVEGRSLSSRQTQDVVRDPEIGQPINSRQCPEAAEGVARESEGRTWLSLLRAVRQDQPGGHPGPQGYRIWNFPALRRGRRIGFRPLWSSLGRRDGFVRRKLGRRGSYAIALRTELNPLDGRPDTSQTHCLS